MSDLDALKGELEELRRGRGLGGENLDATKLPTLYALCGLTAADEAVRARRLVKELVIKAAGDLAPDLRASALGALGVDDRFEGRFLRDRVNRIALHLDRDPRTVWRYMDKALVLIAAALAAGEVAAPPPPPPPHAQEEWLIEELQAMVLLEGEAPEAFELRRVVALRDELDHIDAALSLPRPHSVRVGSLGMRLRVLFGGEITASETVGGNHFRWTIALPAAVRSGESHSYGLHYTMPAGQPMAPRYVFIPMRPAEHFRLTVKFGSARVPVALRRLDGVPPRVLDDWSDVGHSIVPDRLGELAMEFHNLRQGLAYGVRWLWG